ncbi:ABC-type transport system involved in multi-copper enzyme maturation, permease component [Micromonospora citrea]|uniref:ABC-type transport system involved in multi-copper enzyme maturation, permease component n=1 Tax=Micromonospora citrea TaxID=47855 RepID=A0A1C6UEV3_9ACTN|nr:ABC transporter permease subunit [Micromonospora citrea]SCL52566.1 ABC-type transport system involved in multi-copper enzyme maturation, permease component [Micromonospora citrea]
MNLVRAELERLGARRFVQLMLVLLVLAFGVTAATTLAGSHRPTAEEVLDAEQQAAAARQQLERTHQLCLDRQRGVLRPGEAQVYLPDDCGEVDPARMERAPVAADYLTGVFTFASEAEPLLYFLIAFLVLFGFLVGASYIGADLNSGGVVNLLLWRPRRLTVLGAKLGTLLGATALLSLVASAAYLGAFWLIAQVAGRPGRLDGEFWQSLGAVWGRGVLLALLFTAAGFAVATLGRHTSAALGAVAGYLVVWELGARLVMEILDVVKVERYMLSSYVAAWLNGGVDFWDDACAPTATVSCSAFYTVTWQPALVVLLGLTGALTAAAFAVFRRRDLM